MPAVATPAIASIWFPVLELISTKTDFTDSRIVGKDKSKRLSQYIGDLMPEDQVNGFCGFSTTALILNNCSARYRAK